MRKYLVLLSDGSMIFVNASNESEIAGAVKVVKNKRIAHIHKCVA